MLSLGDVSRQDAARFMGVRGEPDSQVSALLDRAMEMVIGNVRPQFVWREFGTEQRDEGIALTGSELILTGKDIARHLQSCKRAVLMAVTLSSEADKLIRKTAVTDVALSLAVDSVCSAAVESACDMAETEIFSAIDAPYRTWRFSPGYGDLPLDLQSKVLAALNAQRRIGLTATDSSLLIPSKSVTAIIGISDVPVEQRKSGCEVCNLSESCNYRRIGVVCRSK